MESIMDSFDKQFKRTGSLIGAVIVFNILVTLAVLGGVGWAGYKLVTHFTEPAASAKP